MYRSYTINREDYNKLGYDIVGPVLKGFTYWLFDQLKMNEIDKVFFLSREGYLLKIAFDLINDGSIETDYLEVSRKSIRLASMDEDFRYTDYLDEIINSSRISLSALLDSFGIDNGNDGGFFSEHDKNDTSLFFTKDELKSGKADNLIAEVASEIKKQIREQDELFYKYLKKKGGSGKFAIVDIGYAGTMQRYLKEYLGKKQVENDIFGLYLGVSKGYERNADIIDRNHIKGYWFDYNSDNYDGDYGSLYVGLLECLFMETGGSVKKYQYDKHGDVIPTRYDSEFIHKIKGKYSKNRLAAIQNGALCYIKNSAEDEYPLIEALRKLEKLGNRPTLRQLQLFEHFCFFNEGEYIPLVNSDGLIKYIFNPKKMLSDFYYSKWKTAFLRKTFTISFPYDIFCDLLLKIRK